MKLFKIAIITAVLSVFVTACGNKGPATDSMTKQEDTPKVSSPEQALTAEEQALTNEGVETPEGTESASTAMTEEAKPVEAVMTEPASSTAAVEQSGGEVKPEATTEVKMAEDTDTAKEVEIKKEETQTTDLK